jgi:arginyl-tRNA synthetase
MLRKLADDGYMVPSASADAVAALASPEEIQLMRQISRFGEIVQAAAENRAPQTVVQYLREVAADFHSFYNAHRIIVDDEAVRSARALLARALQHVLANGLALLGVSAPTAM